MFLPARRWFLHCSLAGETCQQVVCDGWSCSLKWHRSDRASWPKSVFASVEAVEWAEEVCVHPFWCWTGPWHVFCSCRMIHQWQSFYQHAQQPSPLEFAHSARNARREQIPLSSARWRRDDYHLFEVYCLDGWLGTHRLASCQLLLGYHLIVVVEFHEANQSSLFPVPRVGKLQRNRKCKTKNVRVQFILKIFLCLKWFDQYLYKKKDYEWEQSE